MCLPSVNVRMRLGSVEGLPRSANQAQSVQRRARGA